LVRAALELVDEEGAAALTLRSLAARTGSGTATLYRHFHGREDLVGRVVDAVFGEIALDEDLLASAPWDRAARHVAEQMFEALARHPRVAPLVLEKPAAGTHALVLRERCLAVLLANGFDPAAAVRTYATLARFVLGFAIQTGSESDRTSGSGDELGPDTADSAKFPASAQVAAVGRIALAEEFAYGLGLMISGLRADRARAAESTAHLG
jgi:AcrR family transcriptional regulator